jgi:hypothetical protein
MGYMELEGTDAGQAQRDLARVLGKPNAVTMIVLGEELVEIAKVAKETSDNEPNYWWAVWVKNLTLLSEEQLKSYQNGDAKNVVCVISSSGIPTVWIPKRKAAYMNVLMKAFMKAAGTT